MVDKDKRTKNVTLEKMNGQGKCRVTTTSVKQSGYLMRETIAGLAEHNAKCEGITASKFIPVSAQEAKEPFKLIGIVGKRTNGFVLAVINLEMRRE